MHPAKRVIGKTYLRENGPIIVSGCSGPPSWRVRGREPQNPLRCVLPASVRLGIGNGVLAVAKSFTERAFLQRLSPAARNRFRLRRKVGAIDRRRWPSWVPRLRKARAAACPIGFLLQSVMVNVFPRLAEIWPCRIGVRTAILSLTRSRAWRQALLRRRPKRRNQ